MVSDNKAASMFFLKEKAVCFGALGCTDSSANSLEILNGKGLLSNLDNQLLASKTYSLTTAAS